MLFMLKIGSMWIGDNGILMLYGNEDSVWSPWQTFRVRNRTSTWYAKFCLRVPVDTDRTGLFPSMARAGLSDQHDVLQITTELHIFNCFAIIYYYEYNSAVLAPGSTYICRRYPTSSSRQPEFQRSRAPSEKGTFVYHITSACCH